MQQANHKLVSEFVEQIWNKQNFEKLDDFIHPEFKDFSLPPALTPDKEGLKNWIMATCASFEHKTVIEDQVTEGDKSIVKIRMELKHIGVWRDMPPTNLEVLTQGYRFFKIKAGKILEHWALIDGQAIESQLKGASNGCTLPR
ncbi:hypothetical protein AHMF7605_28715 [Adhaeribacter arboris]|uniref:Ester cyclase n=1 Tax=Adhaeribacter arboris TaxID=2072846 RepID=A0A2T2Y8Q6_9BACT|nr:ester cyclase [Adhaeribacter arboris]PSR51895.1 hypothetical protein AHMF7605_28715 [Adhaeribacter arboris]